MPSFYMGAGDPNSGLHAYVAGTFLPEPPPQSPVLLTTLISTWDYLIYLIDWHLSFPTGNRF